MVDRSYKIKYLPLFEADLMEIVEYITFNLKNPKAAADLVSDVERLILERSNCPLAFEAFESVRDREYQYYRIYVRNYVIFYVVMDNSHDCDGIMEVRRILYNKRKRDKYL